MSLRDLFVSKTRVELLKVFLSNPSEIFYVRQLTRLTAQEINAVRRELARLEKRKLVKKEQRANRLYYQLRRDYLFYDELLSMVAKMTGLGKAIIENRKKLGRIKFAMLSGRFVRRLKRRKNEVDLLVVGEVVLAQLAALIKEAEAKRKEEINYTVMTEEEFSFRKRRHDPFVRDVLMGSRIMLIGNEEEMLAVK